MPSKIQQPLPPWPAYSEAELAAVTEVLRSGRGNYWLGEHGLALEREFADYCGSRYGLAVGNGTLALQLALHALGIGAGDEVIVTPRSFVASANCIVLCGARPVFADVDRDSQNLTPESVERVITPRTRAIMAVHLAGWPCDMPGLMRLASDRGLYVIEDCAQAHGAAVAGRKVGSFGQTAAFSFCQDKIISTGGEGGLLLTADEELWAQAAAYRNHGKDPRKVNPGARDFEFQWQHDTVGSNYRMLEVQSVLGRLQLSKLEDWIAIRARNAAVLTAGLLGQAAARTTNPGADIRHAYYKYYFFIQPEALKSGWNRPRLLAEIGAAGVPCSIGVSPEIYREPAYVQRGLAPASRLPVAAELCETSMVVPVHPTLTETIVGEMCDIICSVLKSATR